MDNKPFANLKNMIDTAAGKPKHTEHGTAVPAQRVASYDAGIKMNRMFRNMTEGGKFAVDAAIEAQLAIPFGSHAKDEK